jgi:hypothetical protein
VQFRFRVSKDKLQLLKDTCAGASGSVKLSKQKITAIKGNKVTYEIWEPSGSTERTEKQ